MGRTRTVLRALVLPSPWLLIQPVSIVEPGQRNDRRVGRSGIFRIQPPNPYGSVQPHLKTYIMASGHAKVEAHGCPDGKHGPGPLLRCGHEGPEPQPGVWLQASSRRVVLGRCSQAHISERHGSQHHLSPPATLLDLTHQSYQSGTPQDHPYPVPKRDVVFSRRLSQTMGGSHAGTEGHRQQGEENQPDAGRGKGQDLVAVWRGIEWSVNS